MFSEAEAEIGATFLNYKDALPIRTTLKELGHPKPPTPMQVNNTTSVGFVNDTINQKRPKAFCMRFYWIRDSTGQGQFNIYWGPRSTNIGDYQTKHHAPVHHRLMRPHFLHYKTHVNLADLVIMHLLKGCVNHFRLRALYA